MIAWLFGNRPQRHYEQAMRLYDQGRLEAALAEFEQAVSGLRDESHPYTALARFYRAETQAKLGARLLGDGAYDASLPYLDAALAAQPDYPDLHFRRGVALQQLGRVDEAEVAAREAVRLNSDFAEARVLLSVILRDRDDRVAAREELNRARESGERRPTGLTRFLAHAGEEPRAEALWEHLFDEESTRRRIDRAEALYHSGQIEESREHFEELVVENPTFPDLRLKLAILEYQLGRDERALEHLEQALELNPRFADALTFSAAVLLAQDRVEEARIRYEEARDASLPSPFADYGLAVCRFLLGDAGGCAELVRPLVGQGGAPAEAGALLAFCRIWQGQRELALASFVDLLGQAPGADIQLDAAAFALDVEDDETALRCLSSLPDTVEDPAVALAHAELMQLRGRESEALTALDTYSRERGAHPAILYASAQLLEARDDRALALRRLDELLQAWPDHRPARLQKLHLLRLDGRTVEAESELAALQNGLLDQLAVELERLQLCRQQRRHAEAAALLETLEAFYPMDLRVRSQRTLRWMGPLTARVPEKTAVADEVPQPR